jgi:hypothetical protein
MNMVIETCPHCGMDQDLEEYLLNNDEQRCVHCGDYLFDEPSVCERPDGTGSFTGKVPF